MNNHEQGDNVKKIIKLKITPGKDGIYHVKANKTEFDLLRTGDGENEYLEVFPYDFPFRAIKLMTSDVSMDILESMIFRELQDYTAQMIDLG